MIKKAYAKVNLFLKVTGKEENGYHTVENIMQTVGLYDTVSVEIKSSGGIKVISSDSSLGGENDICYKAAVLYEKESGTSLNAEIKVTKNIPSAAGLGGGSSDAAAVLSLLEAELSLLGKEKLFVLAEKLGADVPFFLVGGTAVCSHYGEKIEKIKDCPKSYTVIAKWGKKDSTAEMYSRLDKEVLQEDKTLEDMLAAIEKGNIKEVAQAVYNSFEAVTKTREITELINIMKDCGALTAHLSGSGPSVFGIFDSIKKAEICNRELKEKGIFSCFTETC